jgi:hypothetical protein
MKACQIPELIELCPVGIRRSRQHFSQAEVQAFRRFFHLSVSGITGRRVLRIQHLQHVFPGGIEVLAKTSRAARITGIGPKLEHYCAAEN